MNKEEMRADARTLNKRGLNPKSLFKNDPLVHGMSFAKKMIELTEEGEQIHEVIQEELDEAGDLVEDVQATADEILTNVPPTTAESIKELVTKFKQENEALKKSLDRLASNRLELQELNTKQNAESKTALKQLQQTLYRK